MLLFYVRHGDPIYHPDSLTPLGHAQADAIKYRLGTHGLDKIYASSSTRAMQTAAPTAEMLKKEINVLDWCHESRAYEEFSVQLSENKRTWFFNLQEEKELLVSNEIRVLGRNWYEHPHYKGTRYKEGSQRIQKEVDAFLLLHGYRHDLERNGYIAENPNDDRIALFAHEGFGKAFMACLLDIPYPEVAMRLEMSHSGMSVIEFDNKEGFVIPRILQYANDSHLFAQRLPLKYKNQIYF